MSFQDNKQKGIIDAFFKDWMHGYSWIPKFHQNYDGNTVNLGLWLQSQPNEKAWLGLRSSLVGFITTLNFYAKTSNEMPLQDVSLQGGASIHPEWETLKYYNIRTVGDLLPHMVPAMELLDQMSLGFTFHAINNQSISDYLP